jgi:uncharacterized protein (DUF302 family)
VASTLSITPDPKETLMKFIRHLEIDLPFEPAVEQVKHALSGQGFGVLTEIDVRQTLADKLGIDTTPQVILGACNPQLAHRALEIDPHVAALLPCNVVVRVHHGHTVVDALDPAVLATITGNPDLEPVAAEAAELIRAALDGLANR